MNNYVLGFCFSKESGEVLLIQKHDHSWQHGLVNGVGGKIVFGETPMAAMHREFLEETEIEVDTWEYLCVVGGNNFKGEEWKMYIYYALFDIPSNFAHENEEGVYALYSSLPKNTERTARWLYGAVKDAMENKALIIGTKKWD